MRDIRISLNDKPIAQLPAPKDGWYLARDTELKGFFVVIGKRKRTFQSVAGEDLLPARVQVNLDAVAVELDFVKPLVALRRL